MKRILGIIALLLALTLCFSAFAQEAPATTDAPIEPPDVGDVCPDFELETLDGETFRLSDYRGKVVFVNLWATWCPPCVGEMPEIEALSQAYPDDLVVLGVSLDESEEDVRAFVEENGYTYRLAMDSDGLVGWKIFPTFSIPNSVFIDPNGIVTSIEVGAAPYAVMEGRFEDALANAAEE